MNEAQKWLLATIKRKDGDVYARFAYHHHIVLGNPAYSRAAWIELESLPVVDLDEYQGGLDALEDRVREKIEKSMKNLLLLVLTDAGYRDLVFALREDDDEVQGVISEIESDLAGRVKAHIHEGQNFGPYAALVSRIKTPI